MNSHFVSDLFQKLSNKKANKGFTLIELLVVMIIIGVLAAVALPNLLAQVGKAKETEGKNGVGALNRSQQNYHFENQSFANNMNDASFSNINNVFGIIVQSPYFSFAVPSGASTSFAKQIAMPKNASKDGVKAYGGAIVFDIVTSKYDTVLCQSNTVGGAVDTNVATLTDATCQAGIEIK
jgi:prepilin-type N-terminal cleavage/methylation domain-containing protein